MATEITVGIAGAAGDGLDRTGDTLARTAARLGVHLYTYNSDQSLIRGSSSTAPVSTATPRSSRRVSLSSPSRCRT